MPSRLDENVVRQRLQDLGISALEPYVNTSLKIRLKCLKHDFDGYATLRNVFNGKHLICCKRAATSERKTYSDQEVKSKCQEIGFELLEVYNGDANHKKYKVRCLKHDEVHPVVLTNLFRNKSIRCCWKEKVIQHLGSGETSLTYKHELTPEYRLHYHRDHGSWDYKLWRKSVKEKYSYKCLYCHLTFGSKQLHAHHIKSYAGNIESRLDLNNGVTLCDWHHKIFHKIYGKNNNQQQFEEFINNNKE